MDFFAVQHGKRLPLTHPIAYLRADFQHAPRHARVEIHLIGGEGFYASVQAQGAYQVARAKRLY